MLVTEKKKIDYSCLFTDSMLHDRLLNWESLGRVSERNLFPLVSLLLCVQSNWRDTILVPGLFGEVPILKKSGPYLVPISEKSGPYLVPFRDFFLVGPNLTTLDSPRVLMNPAPSVSRSVSNKSSHTSHHRFSWLFCNKLACSKCRKVTKPDIWKKSRISYKLYLKK